ncbi:MAG: response regulator transcription factor [Bacteroidetes bacterium]|nr:response regulator transcription factor [Bacteroidota bacterium]
MISTPVYTPIKIVLADDHEIFRDGFAGLLKKQDEIQLVGEAANGEELLLQAQKLKPDIILTDIKMPVMDGIQATRILNEKFPQIYVIALSMFNEDNLVADMMEAGARGYLLKSAHKTEILEAIKAVNRQETYYCRQTSSRLINKLARSKTNFNKEPLLPKFTEREIAVIHLICNEASNAEISASLCLSIRTIEGYRSRIQEKMKVRNTAGIVVYAIKNGLYNIS